MFMTAGAGLGVGLAVAMPLGAIMGSFATAVALRLPRGEDWVAARSRCPACSTDLGIPDLVPILPWLALRGSCRHCGGRISARYPAMEAVMATAFAVPVVANGGIWLDLVPLWLLATVLAVLSLIDLSHRYIPDGCVAMVAVTGMGASLAGFSVPWGDALVGGLLLGSGTWLVRQGVSAFTGREALGLGDVKLYAAAGFWVGAWGTAPLLLGSALAGLVFSLAWRRWGRDAEVPFGPCIAATLYILAV